jgi:hypothetical protein
MSNELGELEAAPGGSTSPPPAPDAEASPEHSSLSGGSASSGYPAPHLSSDESVSRYSWLLNRPPRPGLSPQLPASLHGSARPHPLGLGSSEIPPPPLLDHGLAFPNLNPSSSESSDSEFATLAWLLGLEQVMPQMGSETETAETHSPPERFTPSHHPTSLSLMGPASISWHHDRPTYTPYASASSASLSSHYYTASDGLGPSPNTISEGLPPSPLEDAKSFNKNIMKKLKIFGGVAIVGGIIAGIAGSQISKHKHRDFRDS